MDRIVTLSRSFLDTTIVDGRPVGPDKTVGQALFALISSAIAALADMTTVTVVTPTKTALLVITPPSTSTVAAVIADTVDNNGLYSAPAGSWVKFGALPSDTAAASAAAALASATQTAALLNAAANSDWNAVAVPLWRWNMAVAAFSSGMLNALDGDINGNIADPTRIAFMSGRPVAVGGLVWTQTRATIMRVSGYTDDQMTPIMTGLMQAAVAIVL